VSVVAIPFTDEPPSTVVANVVAAAAHQSVDLVLCVGKVRNSTYAALEEITGPGVGVIVQERLGSRRPGKGDAMNTALIHFLERTDSERLHFYDADITNFDATWIDRAEAAADTGVDVVRHSFPRASTDSMITWMVTRIGFAMLWPDTELPTIRQPLGGELLLTRTAAEALAADSRVMQRSDWGIDTMYTFVSVQRGFGLAETFIPEGKQHRLYGSLLELSTMLNECFAAIQSLISETVPAGTLHRATGTTDAVGRVTSALGYSVDDTIGLLRVGWTDRQADLLEAFPAEIAAGMQSLREYPSVRFMDEDSWHATYAVLLDRYEETDGDWRSLLFRLWAARVLNYTFTEALRGHRAATEYLEGMIGRTTARASDGG
jgi:mannosylglycerate synthase